MIEQNRGTEWLKTQQAVEIDEYIVRIKWLRDSERY